MPFTTKKHARLTFRTRAKSWIVVKKVQKAVSRSGLEATTRKPRLILEQHKNTFGDCVHIHLSLKHVGFKVTPLKRSLLTVLDLRVCLR